MIVRLVVSDTGRVGYMRLPETSGVVGGADVVFRVRDARGNGPDHPGTIVGEIDGHGHAVEMRLLDEDVPGWLDYTLRQGGEIVPSWMEDAFRGMDEIWQGRIALDAPPRP